MKPEQRADARAELGRAIDQLESDLASIVKELEARAARADVLERLAMAAVERGDDDAARAALRERERVVTALDELGAEADVIRATLAECARVLADSGG